MDNINSDAHKYRLMQANSLIEEYAIQLAESLPDDERVVLTEEKGELCLRVSKTIHNRGGKNID